MERGVSMVVAVRKEAWDETLWAFTREDGEEDGEDVDEKDEGI